MDKKQINQLISYLLEEFCDHRQIDRFHWFETEDQTPEHPYLAKKIQVVIKIKASSVNHYSRDHQELFDKLIYKIKSSVSNAITIWISVKELVTWELVIILIFIMELKALIHTSIKMKKIKN